MEIAGTVLATVAVVAAGFALMNVRSDFAFVAGASLSGLAAIFGGARAVRLLSRPDERDKIQ